MATLPASIPSAANPAKRRRLDDALSKPFRSPLKTPLQPKTANPPTAPTPTTPQPKTQASTLQTITDVPTADPPTQHPFPQTPQPPATPQVSIPPTRTPSTHLHALQSRHTALLTLLAQRRAALETSSQALAIETTPDREADLQRLILKWKGASRRAAEEVFAGVRDRVNRMGGVKGLRERERERAAAEVGWGWGNSGGGDEDEEEDGEVEGVGDREARLEREGDEGDYEREMRAGVEGGAKVEEEVDEEGGYTMDMMLRTMNIELEVIGFDKGLQKWVD